MKSKCMIGFLIVAVLTLGCSLSSLQKRPGSASAALPPTRTPKPTFTITPTYTPKPTSTDTPTVTPTPIPPTNTPVPPTNTPVPPTNTPKPKKNPAPQPTATTPPEAPAAEQPAAPQGCAYQFCPGSWYVGDPNAGLTRFYGHLSDTSGNAANGFFVRLVCGSLQIMSFPSGPSSQGPYTEPGFYDLAVQNTPLSLDCTMQIVMYKCEEWFNAQCQNFEPLSEAVHVTTSVSDKETIIVADWTCYHDCSAPWR